MTPKTFTFPSFQEVMILLLLISLLSGIIDLLDNLFLSKNQIGQYSHPMPDPSTMQLFRIWQEEFHSQEQKLLQVLLVAISTTISIPLQAFQLARMLYKENEENCHKRSLYIKKAIIVLGWPQSKSFRLAYQMSLWALLIDVGTILLIFLLSQSARSQSINRGPPLTSTQSWRLQLDLKSPWNYQQPASTSCWLRYIRKFSQSLSK